VQGSKLLEIPRTYFMILFQCKRLDNGGLRVRRTQGHSLRTGYVILKATKAENQEGEVVGWYEVRAEPTR
jgi:hypothetical protein